MTKKEFQSLKLGDIVMKDLSYPIQISSGHFDGDKWIRFYGSYISQPGTEVIKESNIHLYTKLHG